MHAGNPERPDSPNGQWRDNNNADLAHATGAVRHWLEFSGLLTRRLRSACAGEFRLELLQFDDAPPGGPEGDTGGDGMIRDIRLCCGGRPLVFARTVIPRATLAEHGWLADLGESPLGETLNSKAPARRSGFEYAVLKPGDPLFDAAVAGTDITTSVLWGRRSRFLLGAEGLLVYEIFLPAVEECVP